MEKLAKIVEEMAKSKFRSEILTRDLRNQFILKNAKLAEFCDYFNDKKETNSLKSWKDKYGDRIIGEMSGLSESFCYDILWPRMKDSYIESVVISLEKNIDVTYKITIEKQ